MKRAFFIIFVLFVSGNAFATMQIPDILFYDSLKLSLRTGWEYPSPLQLYYYQNNIKTPFQGYSTANYRGHVAVWKVVNSNLYLTEIRIPKGFDQKTFDFIVESYEPNDYGVKPKISPQSENGTVLADWFSGILDCYLRTGNNFTSYFFHVREGLIVNMEINRKQYSDKPRKPGPVDTLNNTLKNKPHIRLLHKNYNYITYYFRLDDDEIKFEGQECKLDTGVDRLSPIFGLYENNHLKWPYNWENTEKSGAPNCKWLIKNGKLYLTGIELYSGLSYYSVDTETLDLTELFNDRVVDGVIDANWVSGVYLIKHGYEKKEDAGWPGYTFKVFDVSKYTYIRLEKGLLAERYTVPENFDTKNLPEDIDPGLRKIIEDYQLPTIHKKP